MNSSIDAWGYALYIRQGINLFLPHHLFHNTIGFLWVKLIGLIIKIDTIKLLIILMQQRTKTTLSQCFSHC